MCHRQARAANGHWRRVVWCGLSWCGLLEQSVDNLAAHDLVGVRGGLCGRLDVPEYVGTLKRADVLPVSRRIIAYHAESDGADGGKYRGHGQSSSSSSSSLFSSISLSARASLASRVANLALTNSSLTRSMVKPGDAIRSIS